MILYEWDSLYYVQLRTAIDSTFDPPNIIYDCEGNIVKKCGGTSCNETCEDFNGNATELHTLWTYDNAPCTCSANEEFVEPEWLTEYINNLENNSEIISGDVSLYKWKNM